MILYIYPEEKKGVQSILEQVRNVSPQAKVEEKSGAIVLEEISTPPPALIRKRAKEIAGVERVDWIE